MIRLNTVTRVSMVIRHMMQGLWDKKTLGKSARAHPHPHTHVYITSAPPLLI